ncbi:hypothetical protein OHC33_007760 [Knufia fluminis]|uniref:DUF6594 domain-containing protein n=1 Tax=Knufia fluminis TaxID=191047 RepID=A0AAN8EI45_9EURO|nr:hypothetical protein OHC33_007760 [Knufia fluminis]
MATQQHYGQGHWPEAAGYQALRNLIGGYPEMAIFRRFLNAGALDLLYRQAELQHIISEWATTAEVDQQIQGPRRPEDPKRNEYDMDFDELRRSIDSHEPGAGNQWRRWSEVSEKLGDFYKDHLEQLRRHLTEPDKGAHFLRGVERLVYHKLNERDLTSIASPDEPDVFTKLARGPITNLLHEVVGRNTHHVVTVPKLGSDDSLSLSFKDYSPEAAVRFSRVLYAALTSIFVTVAIVSLNIAKGAVGRIILITIHNLLFTAAMAVFAKGRPGELFGVAAAYAAVLVVYASGSSGLDAGHASP